VYIGKEANRWEEQSYVGYDAEAEITYGMAPEDRRCLLRSVKEAADNHSQRALAKTAQISLQQVSAILTGVANPTDKTLAKLMRATASLDAAHGADATRRAKLIAQARAECERRGLRDFARSIGIDAANLTKVLAGRRKLSLKMIAKLEQAFPLRP
jgi:plasmid maintenance system antidote protein VapI